MCTLKWWEIEPNNNNIIIILGSCDLSFKLKWIILFQAVAASMANTFPKEPHLLLHKNLNIIKYQLYGAWNDEKVNPKKNY